MRNVFFALIVATVGTVAGAIPTENTVPRPVPRPDPFVGCWTMPTEVILCINTWEGPLPPSRPVDLLK